MLDKGLLVFAFSALAARADLITDCQGSIQGQGPGGLAYQDYGCNVSNSSLGVNFLHTGMTAKYGSLEIVTYGIGSTPDEDSPGSSSTFSVDAVARFTDLITVHGGTGSGSIHWSLTGSWLNGSTHLLAFAMPETFTYGAPFDVDLGIEVVLSGIDGGVDSTREASFQFFDAAGNPIASRSRHRAGTSTAIQLIPLNRRRFFCLASRFSARGLPASFGQPGGVASDEPSESAV